MRPKPLLLLFRIYCYPLIEALFHGSNVRPTTFLYYHLNSIYVASWSNILPGLSLTLLFIVVAGDNTFPGILFSSATCELSISQPTENKFSSVQGPCFLSSYFALVSFWEQKSGTTESRKYRESIIQLEILGGRCAFGRWAGTWTRRFPERLFASVQRSGMSSFIPCQQRSYKHRTTFQFWQSWVLHWLSFLISLSHQHYAGAHLADSNKWDISTSRKWSFSSAWLTNIVLVCALPTQRSKASSLPPGAIQIFKLSARVTNKVLACPFSTARVGYQPYLQTLNHVAFLSARATNIVLVFILVDSNEWDIKSIFRNWSHFPFRPLEIPSRCWRVPCRQHEWEINLTIEN